MSEFMINVSKEFSRMPCVRKRKDGPQSGEEFRDAILAPALRDNETVTVDLDGVLALGSSFLDEAFGGLVREGIFSAKELRRKLVIKFSLKSYVDEAWSYIDSAGSRA